MPSAPNAAQLAVRLKQLRETGIAGRTLTQPQVSKALGVSVPLISSWEQGKSVPPAKRLEAYARLFAAQRATPEGRPQMPPVEQLSGPERKAYDTLVAQLLDMRAAAVHTSRAITDEPRSPLQFPAGQAITIACSELPPRLRAGLGYADPTDPDYVESYRIADLDTLIELLPHVAALNPTSPIKIGLDSELTDNDRTAHLIVLGGVDFNKITRGVLTYLQHVPVKQLERATDDDPGGFSVRTDGVRRKVRPILLDGSSELQEDVAHFLRAPNPYNQERTLTFFNGSYSRGSRGVVRALTDPKIQKRNAAYIAERFGNEDTYSIVCRVKIVANEIIVPDWTLDEIRLHEWPEAAE
jgi:transcriptional regulator with XRE-family HTH domain